MRAIQRSAVAWMVACLLAGAAMGVAGAQEEAEEQETDDRDLTIELNKTEDVNGACHGSFVVFNDLERALERLTLDLYLFDKAGIISQHTVLDMGPIPRRKTRILTFSLANDLCENIDRIVINDMPNCQADGGESIDCLAVSKVWSLGSIGFGM